MIGRLFAFATIILATPAAAQNISIVEQDANSTTRKYNINSDFNLVIYKVSGKSDISSNGIDVDVAAFDDGPAVCTMKITPKEGVYPFEQLRQAVRDWRLRGEKDFPTTVVFEYTPQSPPNGFSTTAVLAARNIEEFFLYKMDSFKRNMKSYLVATLCMGRTKGESWQKLDLVNIH